LKTRTIIIIITLLIIIMFECALISYLSLCGGDSDGRLVGVVEPVWPWDAGDVTKVKVTKLEKVIFRFNKIYVI
jgi:hypothetical protein